METNNNPSPKKEFPYVEILKKAGNLIWQNKFLLWFGVLISLGSGFDLGRIGNNEAAKNQTEEFAKANWQAMVLIGLVALAIFILLFLISLIGRAGLVKSINLLSRDKEASFKKGWTQGKKYLLKLFQLYLLFFLASAVIVAILAMPVIYLAMMHSFVSAILIGILAVAILVPIMIVITLVNIFSGIYIVLSDLKIFSALEAGYNLLIHNLKKTILFGLIIFALRIAAGIVYLPVVLILLVTFVPAGYLFYNLSLIPFILFIIVATPITLAVLIAISAAIQTYTSTAWVLFFEEIAKAKEPETEKVIEKADEISIAPEKV
ncbi:MAG: hypothetical protein WC858_04895 [Parcubacteria group bacterium]|jgi:hypothetical protein